MSLDKPSVAILLPNLRGGGAERVGVYLANEFVHRGMAVDMVLMHADGDLLKILDSRVRLIDLEALRVRNVVLPLTRYMRRHRPEAFVANMWPLTILAPVAKRLARVATRVVAVEHTTWSASELARNSWFLRRLRWSMQFGFRLANEVAAVSTGAAEDVARLASMPRDRIRVLHNPIVGSPHGDFGGQTNELAPVDWTVGLHKKILAVGTLKPIKDFGTLLHAFARVCQQIDAKLLILGEGRQRQELEALVQKLGLAKAVFMPGFSDSTAPYFACADLHVLSSAGEGFGNVIVEALEQGTPVVSTDCPSGPREILDNGRYGTLVPVADVDALAAAMLQSLQSSHDHEALRARAQDFSIEKAADSYLNLLLPGHRYTAR